MVDLAEVGFSEFLGEDIILGEEDVILLLLTSSSFSDYSDSYSSVYYVDDFGEDSYEEFSLLDNVGDVYGVSYTEFTL